MVRPKSGYKSIVYVLLSVVLPIVVISLYWAINMGMHLGLSAFSDYVALSVSILIGSLMLSNLPLRSVKFTLLISLYILIAGLLLVVYSLWFACHLSHSCH